MDKDVIANSRILILDDQEANVLLLERLLQHTGYRHYLSLKDPRQLLEQFRLFEPDLILLDLMMPKLDGYAVMRQLAGWLPNGAYLPVLVISVDNSRTARNKALSLGAKDFITKPLDAIEATARIYNLLLTRWLCRQMELNYKRSMQQAGESSKRIGSAMRLLEHMASMDARLAEGLHPPRVELQRAFDAMSAMAGQSFD